MGGLLLFYTPAASYCLPRSGTRLKLSCLSLQSYSNLMAPEELFKEIAASIPDAKLSKMFGCPCIKAPNGKAGAMLWHQKLIVKPPKPELERLLKSGYEQFTPMEGRPMSGWIVISADQSAQWPAFAQQSYDAVKLLEKKK